MPIVEPSASAAPVIEDGLYVVTCDAVKEKTVDNDQFGNTDKLEISLRLKDVVDEEGEPVFIQPLVNRKWSEKATLFTAAVAFGLNPNPDVAIDTDSFIGLEAKVLIETEKEGAWPRVKTWMAIKTPLKERLQGPPAGESAAADDLSAWWARTRQIGLDRKEVLDKAQELFEKEPVDLSAVERAKVMEALAG